MKFVHIADLHLDTPFTSLSEKGNLGKIRRLEQRNALKKVIEYCKENEVDYLFIAGDLYEQNYVKKTSIDYINNLFKEIENTKIFIAPGNHDPYLKNSIYATYTFSKNVHIFKEEFLEKYEDNDINLYGAAFTEFYKEKISLENVELKENGKANILLLHLDLNGTKDAEGFSYCPISEATLKALNFDYIALGHIHKSNFEKKGNILYPGSLISLGFDELGEHGMIVGEIKDGSLTTDFIPIDERIFEEKNLDISDLSTKEDIIEAINNMQLEEKTMYKIVLIGKRSFEVDSRELLQLAMKENVLKIKDKTILSLDLEKLSEENSLRGIFIKEALKKLETGEATKEEIEKAIELGLEVM